MKTLVLLLLVILFSAPVKAGTFTLDRQGASYSLQAEQAVLSDILAEIDRQEPASLKFYGDSARPVTVSYKAITLDRLLDKLGVSYVLVYETDETGAYQLGDAIMLDSDAPAEDPRSASAIRKLIRDLRDDDIRFNAIKAFWALRDLECAAVPYLEEALYDEDFQGRQAAANLLRSNCPTYDASDRLIDVTLELLSRGFDEESDAYDLIWPTTAYEFLNSSNIYPRARSRILTNVQSQNRQVRLYSSLLAGNHGETSYMDTLVRTLLPHLADNDLRNDAAASAYALYQLGPAVLPHLQSYRNSDDQQQAELVDLIMSSLEKGGTSSFQPVMYVSYNKMPILEPNSVSVIYWPEENFPDENGHYPNLTQPRMTTADYYGPYVPYETAEETTPEPSPTPQTDEQPLFIYVVQYGDTIERIVEAFATTLDRLIQSNERVDFTKPLRIGMVIWIPLE